MYGATGLTWERVNWQLCSVLLQCAAEAVLTLTRSLRDQCCCWRA
jgi:hypothetical protein